MIKTVDILNKFNASDLEMYGDMIKMVNLPDFYKCIAQFSGLPMNKISDEVMIGYIIRWAINKYRFYKMLGNKLRVDVPFQYVSELEDIGASFMDIAKDYPAYYFWFDHLEDQKTNDITRVPYSVEKALRTCLPGFKAEGSTMTHLFSKLGAPADLITRLGRIFENQTIDAFYTISIDPVDMMFASENPYNWDSCYRLELNRDDSHADGCLAAVLDTTSLITYLWEREGAYNMYDTFKFKKVRYYRMRRWIAINDTFAAIHFNTIYPGKSNYNEELQKRMRDIVESTVATYMNVPNLWTNNYMHEDFRTYRMFTIGRKTNYGYSEFCDEYIYFNKALVEVPEPEDLSKHTAIYFPVFDVEIDCPDGCDATLVGSQDFVDEYEDEEGYVYNGNGFIAENVEFHEGYISEPLWCNYCDTECERGLCEDEECDVDCPIWKKYNPICGVDKTENCEIDPDGLEEDQIKVKEGVTIPCEHNCQGCWIWDRVHRNEEGDE